MNVLTGQGEQKRGVEVPSGTIIAFYGSSVPTGWALCDGTNGTPDLRNRILLGDTAAGTGSAAGTVDPTTGLTHTGFALGAHDAHAVTQPSAHSAHTPTQPAAHSAHSATQPADHGTHANGGGHTHTAHTTMGTGSALVGNTKLVGPSTHSADGNHTHDAHPPHTGWGVDAHSAHAGFAVDAHSAHAGFAVDAHSAHSVTQPDTHVLKHHTLAYIFKL